MFRHPFLLLFLSWGPPPHPHDLTSLRQKQTEGEEEEEDGWSIANEEEDEDETPCCSHGEIEIEDIMHQSSFLLLPVDFSYDVCGGGKAQREKERPPRNLLPPFLSFPKGLPRLRKKEKEKTSGPRMLLGLYSGKRESVGARSKVDTHRQTKHASRSSPEDGEEDKA